ncbi:hypothetical protein ACJ41O_003306 [Fusarium nematophilum]
MRLIDVITLELKTFLGERGVPPYAILSHVWTAEEVTFQEMSGDHSILLQKKGYEKIVGFCAKSRSEGFRYAWIDTCCIDKTSSAELSEAINSMFRWYRKAAACYVFLNDVPSAENPLAAGSRFRRSRWFTRGWTLQELLAPYEIIFLADDWHEIGNGVSLSDAISKVTTIDAKTLLEHDWSHVSIAKIMSWASRRQTTRVEDQAYSLMGIFDVNMPLIYGEGYKAFYRLQIEIMKFTDDESLFAWSTNGVDFSSPTFGLQPRDVGTLYRSSEDMHLGLLAPAPVCFMDSHGVSKSAPRQDGEATYVMDKEDIRLSARVLRLCELPPLDSQPKPGLKRVRVAGRLKIPGYYGIREGLDDRHVIVHWADDPGLRELCFLLVLRCEDEDGAVAIPVQGTLSGRLTRFAAAHDRGWYKVTLKDMFAAVRSEKEEENDLLTLRLAYELQDSPSHMWRYSLEKDLVLPAYLTIRPAPPRPGYGERYPQAPAFLFRSLPVEHDEYRITSDYPRHFMIPLSDGESAVYEATQRINKAIGIVELLYLNFQARSPEKKLPPFQICLERRRVSRGITYDVRCLVGAQVDGWGQRVDVGDACTRFPLDAGLCLVFRVRKDPSGGADRINVSVETQRPWEADAKDESEEEAKEEEEEEEEEVQEDANETSREEQVNAGDVVEARIKDESTGHDEVREEEVRHDNAVDNKTSDNKARDDRVEDMEEQVRDERALFKSRRIKALAHGIAHAFAKNTGT